MQYFEFSVYRMVPVYFLSFVLSNSYNFLIEGVERFYFKLHIYREKKNSEGYTNSCTYMYVDHVFLIASDRCSTSCSTRFVNHFGSMVTFS